MRENHSVNTCFPHVLAPLSEETFDEMASLTILIAPTKKDEASALFDVLGDRRRAAIQKGVADGTLKRMQTQRTQAPAR